MIRELVNNEEYLKLKLLSVEQKGKRFYVGKVSAKFFLDVYTVEPAEYDMYKQSLMAAKFKDEEDYFNYLVRDSKEEIDSKAFQRKEDKDRVKEIAEFLREEEYSLFPNTIIVTCDLVNELLTEEIFLFSDFLKLVSANNELKKYAFLEEIEGNYFLYLPNVKNSILVIDGQHRIRGLEESSPELQNSYEILLSFLIDYDRSTIAKLFYTINYTQKSVNKSQLYHLTGEFSKQLNEIAFMHEAVRILNEIESSALFHRIKMLGYIPEDTPEKDKKYLTISQAFLIDYLVPTIIMTKSRKTIYQPVFLYYYNNKELRIEIVRFLLKYFNAIKDIFPKDWSNPESSIIVRSISIGAFLQILHILFIIILKQKLNYNADKIKEITKDDIASLLKGVEKIDFSKKGEFGGGISSAGSLSKLKEKIISMSAFAEGKTYHKFIEDFKSTFIPEFRDWLSNNA